MQINSTGRNKANCKAKQIPVELEASLRLVTEDVPCPTAPAASRSCD